MNKAQAKVKWPEAERKNLTSFDEEQRYQINTAFFRWLGSDVLCGVVQGEEEMGQGVCELLSYPALVQDMNTVRAEDNTLLGYTLGTFMGMRYALAIWAGPLWGSCQVIYIPSHAHGYWHKALPSYLFS